MGGVMRWGRCSGRDSNPGAADETITHWLPANALPTPEAQ
jgi:hypothetical protein